MFLKILSKTKREILSPRFRIELSKFTIVFSTFLRFFSVGNFSMLARNTFASKVLYVDLRYVFIIDQAT